MTSSVPLVFLLNVDNTLLDNDQIIADLKDRLTEFAKVEGKRITYPQSHVSLYVKPA